MVAVQWKSGVKQQQFVQVTIIIPRTTAHTNCVDIDECSGTSHGCDQICTNTPGSYICDCNSGYRLGADKRGC